MDNPLSTLLKTKGSILVLPGGEAILGSDAPFDGLYLVVREEVDLANSGLSGVVLTFNSRTFER
jgi:hypothetical protein